MRKTLAIMFWFISLICSAQTHLEYISEKTDSMALISKTDIDLINNVFNERNKLDSLYNLNELIISTLETKIMVQDSIIINQDVIIDNNEQYIDELKTENNQNLEIYSKELKEERAKKVSFQALTGASIIAIILLILI